MQQINLLNPDLRLSRHRLNLGSLALLLLLTMAGMALAATLSAMDATRLQQRVEEVAGLQRTLQARLDQVSAQAKRAPDAQLAAELARTQDRVKATQEVLVALDAGAAGGNAAFSNILNGLSRQTMPGVWLTGITAAGPSLDIRGRLLDADLMPAYLERLKGEVAFQGRRFGDFILNDHAPVLDKKEAAEPQAPDERKDVEPGPARYVEFDLKALPTVLPSSTPSVALPAPVHAQVGGQP